jgi:hypothetical protein
MVQHLTLTFDDSCLIIELLLPDARELREGPKILTFSADSNIFYNVNKELRLLFIKRNQLSKISYHSRLNCLSGNPRKCFREW